MGYWPAIVTVQVATPVATLLYQPGAQGAQKGDAVVLAGDARAAKVPAGQGLAATAGTVAEPTAVTPLFEASAGYCPTGASVHLSLVFVVAEKVPDRQGVQEVPATAAWFTLEKVPAGQNAVATAGTVAESNAVTPRETAIVTTQPVAAPPVLKFALRIIVLAVTYATVVVAVCTQLVTPVVGKVATAPTTMPAVDASPVTVAVGLVEVVEKVTETVAPPASTGYDPAGTWMHALPGTLL
jgi:hypothetical protein